MVTQKTQLKRHIEYLYARRSGAEFCVGLDAEGIKQFIHSLSTSLQENSVKLATIEQEEQRIKDEEKAALKAAIKARRMA